MENNTRIIKLFLILGLLSIVPNLNLEAQPNKNVKSSLFGVIVDEFNNPLSGVIVKINNGIDGDITDSDGKFNLSGIYTDSDILTFQLLGYKTKNIVKGDKKEFYVKLEADVTNSDYEVNLLYDHKTVGELTQSVAYVTGEELHKTHSHSLGAALAGRFPGLIVRSNSNTPGAETYILNVRGTSTSTGNSPLILIDGMVNEDFSYLNPSDVESVTIYKDAAATALYGMQAGNGAISIRTKRGEISKPEISLSADYSIQQPLKKPHILDSWQYASLMNEAYKNDGYGDFYMYSSNEIESYKNKSNLDLYPNNNWYDMFMKSMVQTQSINVSARGGSKYIKYYTSLGYMHQENPFKTDNTNKNDFGLHRFNVRSNMDVKINDFISGYVNIFANIEKNTVPKSGESAIMSSMFQTPSTIYGPLTPDGKVIVTPEFPNSTYGLINRSGHIRHLDSHINADMGINFDLDFITKGLSVGGSAKFYTFSRSDIIGNTNYERWTRDLTSPNELIFTPYGSTVDEPTTLSKGVMYSYMSELDFSINYNREFGNHSFSGLFFTDYQYENPNDAQLIEPYNRLTFGLRTSYSYKKLFFIDAVTSIQGSEQFNKGHRYGTFPAVSSSLVLSNMNFMRNAKDIISLLKLRASYGVSGNDNMTGERFLYKDRLIVQNGGLIPSFGFIVSEQRISNPLISWEKNHILNVGLDLALMNHVSIGLDFFNEDRKDVLSQIKSIPASSGFSDNAIPYINSGRIINKGIDFSLGYSKKITKDLYLGLNGNISYNHNEIKKIDEVYLGDDYTYPYRLNGYSVGELWGYQIDYSGGNGYFNSYDDIIASGLVYEGREPRPGDFKYKDLNGDKVIDDKDKAPIGQSIPSLSWGSSMDLKWKRFDISLLFQGLSGFQQYYSGCGFFETAYKGTFFDQHLNAWTKEKFESGEKIEAPALSISESASHKPNNYFIRNANFIRLKNLELGYMLPDNWAKKLTCDMIRIYASGMNLLTFDKMNNMDIEMRSVDQYPVTRNIVLGLKVVF